MSHFRSMTIYLATDSTVGTDVLSTQTPETIPGSDTTGSIENIDKTCVSNETVSSVATHSCYVEQNVTLVTDVTDHTHTPQ